MATQTTNAGLSDPLQFWSYWLSLLPAANSAQGAPTYLQQPILPWSFTGLVVNETNSSNPAAEQAIVSRDSYGRQLGRISDALDYVIRQLASDQPIDTNAAELSAFDKMKKRIDAIKNDTESAWFERMLKELKKLKDSGDASDKARFDSYMSILRGL
ncbi:hypothetical protein [Paraburkholderia caballeronis]|uniref:Uncharacterized protein n=1 Tax=Paraburkholderia caballeronis TaxID=416943 RepID=A0A1H7SH48_9BURK|nr:hypothetical protein [Paraburkholderia caballeronis]PXW22289.1 hypothetical protein C7403_11513 [Paraburkholderia caballeronis]PXW95948.1 hypothetical protein C7407_11513 [Paraburkholderia caballeronis]RAJ92314.1 hypothetical protein C7409_11513 [Paraburkholderia caballeronis]TDV08119.1 hypothetical protein C7408_118113 [Paraburkholderia caballeronis]TDV11817.1 hypothetical protein C7406_11914 [Paraburkholderia caballeronis]